jgi:hypothetical protein
MARTKQVNKADIEFDTAYLYREIDAEGVAKVYANVGYRIVTVEGESWGRELERFEIKGQALQQVASLFAALKSHLESEEGIV